MLFPFAVLHNMDENGGTKQINNPPGEDGDFSMDMLLDLQEDVLGMTESIPTLDNEHLDPDHAITSNEELLQDR
jgi:hypothetical protein